MEGDRGKTERVIRHFAGYVLLDSCASPSAGFYNGQAGAALALFESARALDDAFLEDEASRLLQEALASKGTDVGFRDGWAGIGFVLAYLIQNRFVDADFDELLGKQANLVYEYMQEGIYKRKYMLRDMALAFFAHFLARQCGRADWENLEHDFCMAIEGQLLCALDAYETRPNPAFRMEFPDMFVTYLELTRLGGCRKRETVIGQYGKICGKHSALHSFYIDHTGGWGGEGGTRTPYDWPALLHGLPLKHAVDVLHLLFADKEQASKAKDWMGRVLGNMPLERLEKMLLPHLHPQMRLSGYGNGISRFLLLLCQWEGERRKEDMGRMDHLFKP